jgi:hypothetical protein
VAKPFASVGMDESLFAGTTVSLSFVFFRKSAARRSLLRSRLMRRERLHFFSGFDNRLQPRGMFGQFFFRILFLAAGSLILMRSAIFWGSRKEAES